MPPAALLAFQAVGSLVSPFEHCLVGLYTCLKRKWVYVKKLSENLENLEEQVRLLQAKERDVRKIIEENVGQRVTNECTLWLSNVEKKVPVLEDLKTRHNNINKRFCGLCPFPSLLKLGKDLVKETDKIDKLIEEAIRRDQVMANSQPAPESYVRKHALAIDDLPSLNDNVKRIEKLLEDDKVNILCMYGLPGVGKTTVMKNVHDSVGKADKFGIIFWVTLTEKDGLTCVEAIQRVLEERLGLEVKEGSTNQARADQLSKEIQGKRSYLLFLDQVAPDVKFKLEDVGIYPDRDHGKVVFACNSSRYHPFSETDDEFEIKGLSESDAFKLFKKIVKEDTLRNEKIKSVAESIVRECGGMPKLIAVIARNLREKNDLALWRNTLENLRKPGLERSNPQARSDYFKFFKLAYDTMNVTEQHCLLYWEIFPSGHEIDRDYIIECWRTEQLFTEGKSFDQTRDSGHGILTDFVDTGLLERGTKARHYKMFVLFWPAAKQFAQKCNRASHQQLIKSGEEWRDAERVSYICQRLSTLPEEPNCSGVRTLFLQENQSLLKIPDAFFTCMESLQLLDLHDTSISSLPSSISRLRMLKSLYLNDCSRLEELPSEIGQLQSLEIFDLSRTGIHRFLMEIEKLTNLKCLRISFEQDVSISSHNHIDAQPMAKAPAKTISELALLEELSICVNQSNKKWACIVDTIVEQVAGLEELTALCFYFPEVKCLKSFTETSKSWNRVNEQGENTLGSGFRSFSIGVGYHQTNSSIILDKSECSAEKHLTFCGGEDMPDSVLQVLKQACTLELIGHRQVTSLSNFGAEMLKGLEICKVEECKQMESIFDGNLNTGFEVQCLKMLFIVKLPTLKHIWKGSMKPDSLPMLSTLIVKDCPRLKNLFSRESEMVLKLPKIQHIEVDNCIEMEEIIESGSAIERRALQKLTSIDLRNLPKLLTICHSDVPMDWPSLEIIKIKGCQLLKNLPLTAENATRLDRIIMPHTLRSELHWPSDGVKRRFESMFSCAAPISSR